MVQWLPADILDPGGLSTLIGDVLPDCLFHLAGFASGARAREVPGVALRVNAEGTLNLLEAVVAVRGAEPSFVRRGRPSPGRSPDEKSQRERDQYMSGG